MKIKLKFRIFLVVLVSGLIGLASLLPLLWASERPMPGFIYSPFYTTNIFVDNTLNGYIAGLRPEDRVIQVNHLRIEHLTPTAREGGNLYLAYELKQALITINIQSQNWTLNRLLEKSLPLFLSGLLIILLVINILQKRKFQRSENLLKTPDANGKNLNLLIFSYVLMGLALLSAPDYFLAPGGGRESGFDPIFFWQQGDFAASTAKWSTYFYFPIWTLAASSLGFFYLYNILQQVKAKYRRWVFASCLLILSFDLGDYLYSALKTMHYNNPDYLIWHVRNEFWLLWPTVVVLALCDAGLNSYRLSSISHQFKIRFNTILEVLSIGLFVACFIGPTVLDIQLPGIGPQWWTFLVVLFARLRWTAVKFDIQAPVHLR